MQRIELPERNDARTRHAALSDEIATQAPVLRGRGRIMDGPFSRGRAPSARAALPSAPSYTPESPRRRDARRLRDASEAHRYASASSSEGRAAAGSHRRTDSRRRGLAGEADDSAMNSSTMTMTMTRARMFSRMRMRGPQLFMSDRLECTGRAWLRAAVQPAEELGPMTEQAMLYAHGVRSCFGILQYVFLLSLVE